MLGNEGQSAEVTSLLAPVSAANTAAATSAWVDARKYEGDLVFSVQTGVVTAGQIVWTIEHASDGSGTGAAAITPNEGAFTVVTTANDPQTEKRTVSANAIAGWVRVVGTITTGPSLVAATLLSRPKYG